MKKTTSEHITDNDALVKWHIKQCTNELIKKGVDISLLSMDDLLQAGRLALVLAEQNFDETKGVKFSTYASTGIYYAIRKEIEFQSASGRFESLDNLFDDESISFKDEDIFKDTDIFDELGNEPDEPQNNHENIPAENEAVYNSEQRTIQVLKILKQISDENHPVKQSDILLAMRQTGNPLTTNPGTLSNTIDEIILALNPLVYTEESAGDFRIGYNKEAYKNTSPETHLVLKKQKIRELRKRIKKGEKLTKDELKLAKEKAPSITDIFYIHDFTKGELDKLIDAINASSRITPSDKKALMRKVKNTAGLHYHTPFYDDKNNALRFYNSGIYDRLSANSSDNEDDISFLINNINIIQSAIDLRKKISFHFNDILADGTRKPRKYRSSDKLTVSPYYMVVYHEQYYLIGVMDGKKNVGHYRIDLISEIDVLSKNIAPMRDIDGLPLKDEWNPEKYMREHMNMFYGTPRDIDIKIKSGNYILIRDWFGEHYKSRPAKEDGYDYVTVNCVSDAIVHFAMQYGDAVEVLDEEIRAQIEEEIKKLSEKYTTSLTS